MYFNCKSLIISYYSVITTNCGLNVNIFLNYLSYIGTYASFGHILKTKFDDFAAEFASVHVMNLRKAREQSQVRDVWMAHVAKLKREIKENISHGSVLLGNRTGRDSWHGLVYCAQPMAASPAART